MKAFALECLRLNAEHQLVLLSWQESCLQIVIFQGWSWEHAIKILPTGRLDDSAPAALRKHRVRQKTPRLPSKSFEHQVNFTALREFLGYRFPKTGRSVIMQIASASEDGKIPTAVPQ